MNKFLSLCLCLLFVLLALPVASQAGDTKSKIPPDPRAVITAIDLTKQTLEITHAARGIVTPYRLTPETTVEIRNKSATLKDLKTGMHVRSLRVGTGEASPQVLEDLDIR